MGEAPELRTFRIGERYSIEHIHCVLNVGNAGGIRACIGKSNSVKRLVVLTAAPSAKQARENPYHDRIEGDILFYTGTGREGDQTLAGVNKRIPQQLDGEFPIYGFMIVENRRKRGVDRRRWQFLGLLEYLRHYPNSQIDARGSLRKIWAFEFRILASQEVVWVDHELAMSHRLIRVSRETSGEAGQDTAIEPSKAQDHPVLAPVEVEKMRSRLLGVEPQKFEFLIKDLLVATGFDRIVVTKYCQDGGIDINAHASHAMWPISGLLVQVQAKRWLHTVGRREVAELRGSLQPNARGTMVTTSHYSRAAISEAIEAHKVPIVLVDGYSLASLFIQNQLPVDQV